MKESFFDMLRKCGEGEGHYYVKMGKIDIDDLFAEFVRRLDCNSSFNEYGSGFREGYSKGVKYKKKEFDRGYKAGRSEAFNDLEDLLEENKTIKSCF